MMKAVWFNSDHASRITTSAMALYLENCIGHYEGVMALTTIAFATITYRFAEHPYLQQVPPSIRAGKVRQLYRKLL
jgi:hypothetical protein